MEVTIRPARPGDGADLARGWLDGCRYYAAQDPQRFQVPDDEGRMGYQRASIVFEKRLDSPS